MPRNSARNASTSASKVSCMGWLLTGNPPEFGGCNATVLQQYVHAEELSRRRIYQSFNPQGVGIIAASVLSFGTASRRSGLPRN
jgi:hypothetical protein